MVWQGSALRPERDVFQNPQPMKTMENWSDVLQLASDTGTKKTVTTRHLELIFVKIIFDSLAFSNDKEKYNTQITNKTTGKQSYITKTSIKRQHEQVTDVMLNMMVSLITSGQYLVIRSSCNFAVHKQYYQDHLHIITKSLKNVIQRWANLLCQRPHTILECALTF